GLIPSHECHLIGACPGSWNFGESPSPYAIRALPGWLVAVLGTKAPITVWSTPAVSRPIITKVGRRHERNPARPPAVTLNPWKQEILAVAVPAAGQTRSRIIDATYRVFYRDGRLGVIWLFSSAQSTIVCSGGLRSNPTIASSFSANSGSLLI